MAAAGILLPLLGIIGAAVTGGPKVFNLGQQQSGTRPAAVPTPEVMAPKVRTVPAVDSFVIWRDPTGDTSNPLLDIREVTALGKQGELVLSVTFAGWLDHLAGCLLGVGVGLVLSCLAYMVINHFSPQADLLRNSQLVPYLEQLAQWGRDMLPQLLKGGFDWQPQLPDL